MANWITAVAGLYGTDLLATASSTGHIQLWRVCQPSRLDQVEENPTGQLQMRSQVTLERLKGRSIALVS